MIEAHLVWKGSQREVYALVKKQRLIFEEDLYDSIPHQTADKIDEYIKFLSDARLPITNKHINRKLQGYDNLFELKPKNTRIFYFFFGHHVILISGCFKKPKKANEIDIVRAEKLKREFLSEN